MSDKEKKDPPEFYTLLKAGPQLSNETQYQINIKSGVNLSNNTKQALQTDKYKLFMMAKHRVLGNICCHIKVFTILNKQGRQGISLIYLRSNIPEAINRSLTTQTQI